MPGIGQICAVGVVMALAGGPITSRLFACGVWGATVVGELFVRDRTNSDDQSIQFAKSHQQSDVSLPSVPGSDAELLDTLAIKYATDDLVDTGFVNQEVFDMRANVSTSTTTFVAVLHAVQSTTEDTQFNSDVLSTKENTFERFVDAESVNTVEVDVLSKDNVALPQLSPPCEEVKPASIFNKFMWIGLVFNVALGCGLSVAVGCLAVYYCGTPDMSDIPPRSAIDHELHQIRKLPKVHGCD